MKLTDFALIFIAIFLPIVVIVYVNTSFVVKSEKQEMYYKNMINSAVTDAVSAMKHIENEDQDIDYGYSGERDKKVSINSDVAISTFYNSLANNFNIANNDYSIERLKMYIPVIAVLDYDGIYIHSAEEKEDGDIQFITKPKVYYTYYYVITKTSPSPGKTVFEMVELTEVQDLKNAPLASKHIYEVKFTMDDFVYFNIYDINNESEIGKLIFSKDFYLKDDKNNYNLVYYDAIEKMTTTQRNNLRNDIEKHLDSIRLERIAQIGMKEISYAVNKHNIYAKDAGISYTFRFSVESDNVWYETMDGIGMLAIVQGISLGNRYLNYKAYSAADLTETQVYYLSKGTNKENKSYLNKDLYHISNKCKVFLEYKNSTSDKLVPSFYSKKADAATHGYYPCPICKP